MIVYNVTAQVMPEIAKEWLDWMQQIHIPEVMETNAFTDYRLHRLLDVDETEGPTYSVQYFADTKNDYDNYIAQHAPTLRQRAFDKWGDKFIAFRSLMETVNNHSSTKKSQNK